MIAPTLASVLWSGLGILAFCALLFIGSPLLPRRTEPGAPRGDGESLSYRLNGLGLFLITLAVAAGSELGGLRLGLLFEHYWSLLIAVNALAFALSFLLLWIGRRAARPSLRSFFYGAER